jgi:hypothetical protein
MAPKTGTLPSPERTSIDDGLRAKIVRPATNIGLRCAARSSGLYNAARRPGRWQDHWAPVSPCQGRTLQGSAAPDFAFSSAIPSLQKVIAVLRDHFLHGQKHC